MTCARLYLIRTFGCSDGGRRSCGFDGLEDAMKGLFDVRWFSRRHEPCKNRIVLNICVRSRRGCQAIVHVSRSRFVEPEVFVLVHWRCTVVRSKVGR